jgi:hypothetical protein
MRTVIYILVIAGIFVSGYFCKQPRHVIKEVQVYDFTQSPEIVNAYASVWGMRVVKTKDPEYTIGYRDGYRDGYRKCKGEE